MISNLIMEFSRLCLKYKDRDVKELLTAYSNNKDKLEQNLILNNFMLFIKCGESTLSAPSDIQREIEKAT